MNPATPIPQIILFAKQNPQNAVLLGYLTQKLAVQSLLQTQPLWQEKWTQEQIPALVVIDTKLASQKRISALLAQINAQTLELRVVLLNAEINPQNQDWLSTPALLAIYCEKDTEPLGKTLAELYRRQSWQPKSERKAQNTDTERRGF